MEAIELTTQTQKYLQPEFENVRSYYNKAYYTVDDDIVTLYSYNTKIATISDERIKWITKDSKLLTNTTIRHLKEFIKQFTKLTDEKLTKNDLIKIANELS